MRLKEKKAIISLYKYTDKEKEQIVKSMVFICDSREKDGDHIIDWLDKKKIQHITKALSNGDYSFYVPANAELNIDRDLYFDKHIMVERKGSLEELSGNLSTNRARFEEELATYGGKKYLLVENSKYSDIVNQKYDTKLSSKAYLASVHTFNHRYNLEIVFMPDKSHSPVWIYGTFTYYLRELLK